VGDAGENLNQVLSHYISGIYLKSLLRYEDRNSMRFSIESRTPFADDIHLINYLFSLSAVWKIRNGVNKILLRKSVGDLLPPKILARRDKLGFAIPETEWLKKAGPKIREYITDDLSEYLNVTRIQKDWDKILAGGSDCSTTFLWRLINFAVFKHVSGVKN
jgi:asparagine synthase (glutamine-hydrolysing)